MPDASREELMDALLADEWEVHVALEDWHEGDQSGTCWAWEISGDSVDLLYGHTIYEDELVVVRRIVAEHNELRALRMKKTSND